MGKGRGGAGRRAWQRGRVVQARVNELANGVPETPVAAEAILAEVQRMGLQPTQNTLTPTVIERGLLTNEYSFQTSSGQVVSMTAKKATRDANSAEIAFTVNGGYERTTQMSEADRRATTTRLLEAVWIDAQSRPEGFRYHGTAFSDDGYGDQRAAAYQAVGFTPPYSGQAGSYQYALVKNGRLVPDTNMMRISQIRYGIDPDVAQRTWAETRMRVAAASKPTGIRRRVA